MYKSLGKILSILCVLVMFSVAFSSVVKNVTADENEEISVVSLNPDVATNEYIHMVWQENLTGNMEVYFVNDMGVGNYENTLRNAINDVQLLLVEDDDYEDVLNALDKALEEYNEGDFKHSINKVHHAVKDLEKIGNIELIHTLVDAVQDFAKTNILYAEYDLTFNNSYIQEAYEKYLKADKKYSDEKYDAAIKMFKNSYLKIVEAYEENDEAFMGVDFGKILRISYTDFDSVNPQIFLNGTINVCWEEIIGDETHAYFARSSNNGISWWYFDATEHAYTYLCYAGINPALLSMENKLLITKTLERILIIDRCHYFYVPIIKDGFRIEDRRVYSPIDDPYLTLHEYKEPILIGDKKIYIICGGGDPVLAPDLIVSSISTSPNNMIAVESSQITIKADVVNLGNANVGGSIDVNFYDGTTLIGGTTVSNVPSGGTAQASITWESSLLGNHSINVKVDQNNGLPEGNESNNEITKNVKVLSLSDDDDNDGLTNGEELSSGAIWFEAEDYPYHYETEVIADIDASMGRSIYSKVYDYATVYIRDVIPVGIYD
ncbi:MAG: hypothetical protein KJ655_00820, partial [Candidatus Thermoplasmatota archaeon]|nr:hypothetical protein [Candidatus Thermoplasmatota archaeon]